MLTLTPYDIPRFRDILARRDQRIATKIPNQLLDSINAYVLEGQPQGHFIKAVICNDLFDAVARADLESQRALSYIVQYFVNYCPDGCYGSIDKYSQWVFCHSLLRKK